MIITTKEIVTIELTVKDIQEAVFLHLRNKGITEINQDDIRFVFTEETCQMEGAVLEMVKNKSSKEVKKD